MSKLSAAFRPSAPNDRTFKSVSKANEYFAKKEYKLAIGNYKNGFSHYERFVKLILNFLILVEYTKALTLAQPSLDKKNATAFSALIFSNRSASYYQCNKWVEAIKDADQVIRIKPEWPKVNSYSNYSLLILNIWVFFLTIIFIFRDIFEEPKQIWDLENMMRL